MSKIIDITEKLSFDTSPVIKIKDIELKVNDDASTALKMMAIMSDSGDNVGIKEIVDMYQLLFDEKDRKKIDALKLKFTDFAELVKTAMGLVTGNEELGE
ncbi:MAG TPA: hypothetical protein IAC41_04350 [Candidatus Merdenecus merdavium]|nr:hypothetical protein [Candidatus Merdenecus merdavium]